MIWILINKIKEQIVSSLKKIKWSLTNRYILMVLHRRFKMKLINRYWILIKIWIHLNILKSIKILWLTKMKIFIKIKQNKKLKINQAFINYRNK
jgi:hypothetical protein